LAIGGIKNVNFNRKVAKKNTVKMNAMSNALMEKNNNNNENNRLNSEKSTN
jgi:hypothetical protein